jgi:hypothetical protein
LTQLGKCPPERHKPELPKIPLYVSDETLETVSEEVFNTLPTATQEKFFKTEGFAGCGKCKLFSACRTRLATNQQSKAKMLKPIDFVIGKFLEVDTEIAKAQLLCWKPSTEGLIYPRFDRETHVIPLSVMYKKVLGNDMPAGMNKKQFHQMLLSMGVEFFGGLDWGFTHAFSCVVGFVFNNICYVTEVISAVGLEVIEKVEICNEKIKYLNPTLFPDNESPSDIKTFKKFGYKCRDFTKDVQSGINAVRTKLRPSMGIPPQLFILDNDPGCEFLIQAMKEYHWKVDPQGIKTDKPHADGADECFTSATEVLTKDGWISLADVKENDEVLAVTKENLGQWEKPVRIINKSYKGKVYELKHRELEFIATENHRTCCFAL